MRRCASLPNRLTAIHPDNEEMTNNEAGLIGAQKQRGSVLRHEVARARTT